MAKWLKMTDFVGSLKFNQASSFLCQAARESNFNATEVSKYHSC